MSQYYDALETRSPDERESQFFTSLPQHIANAKAHTTAFGRTLADFDADAVRDRAALAALPVMRKSGLIDLQAGDPPFGGLAATPTADLARVFVSPGPIFEPEAKRNNYWRLARALYAAGFRLGDLTHNAFAYHMTPAGSMLETGLHALGCPVIPAGVGQTELQIEVITRLRPVGYVGTPSFLKLIMDKAAEKAAPIESFDKALVSGEALPPSLRDAIGVHGIAVLQCYATADLGLIAYESGAREGMIIDEEILVEIVRPGTGDPVPEGEVGEVLVTTLNPDYPMIRFATGDLSAVLPGPSPCGRTNMRIKGWMGRADQTTKVKGIFVHPEQVNGVLKRHAEIQRARLVVETVNDQDVMTLHCEVAQSSPAWADRIANSIRELCKLRGEVELVDAGSLPNDGKVIDDARSYQ